MKRSLLFIVLLLGCDAAPPTPTPVTTPQPPPVSESKTVALPLAPRDAARIDALEKKVAALEKTLKGASARLHDMYRAEERRKGIEGSREAFGR